MGKGGPVRRQNTHVTTKYEFGQEELEDVRLGYSASLIWHGPCDHGTGKTRVTVDDRAIAGTFNKIARTRFIEVKDKISLRRRSRKRGETQRERSQKRQLQPVILVLSYDKCATYYE